MKHNLINCYIDGKKSAIAIVENVIYLMSHSSNWDGAKLDNMLGWKFAKRICAVGPYDYAPAMVPGYIKEILLDFAGIDAQAVIVEGMPEFDAIRANIRRCPGRTRKPSPKKEEPAKETPKQEPAPQPQPAPIPEPKPEPKTDEVRHAIFNEVNAYLNSDDESDRAVYLYGPAGSGKNVICEQLARENGIEFYYTNSVMDATELEGFRDAAGVFHETEFYRAFKNGGLFMLDEADGSIPEALIRINAALANRYFVFGGTRIQAHPDFRVIAAGNTTGNGATEVYNGRVKLDGATLDRFWAVAMDYDRRVEAKVAKGDKDILEFVRDLRQSSKAAGIPMILGYRCMKRLANLRGKVDDARLVAAAVLKGMDRDEVKIVWDGLKHKENPFAVAMA
jgi:hypothetical protein